MGQELFLQITLDENGSVATVNNLGNAIVKAGDESSESSGKVDKLSGSFSKSDSSVSSFIHTLKSLGAVYAVMRIERMVEGWSKMAIAQDQADRSLKAAMVTNNRFSEQFYQSTLKQAQAIQRLTGIDDEQIERGQKMLMLYGNISNEAMPRATKAMANMAALMGGDMQSAAAQLGKALEGHTEGLRRVGIMVDQNVYKQRGAIGVLEEIEKKVSGQAEALAQGSGKWKVLGTQVDETKEGLGKLFNRMAEGSGIIDMLTGAVNKLNQGLTKLNELDINKAGISPTARAFDIVSRNVENKRLQRVFSDMMANITASPEEIIQNQMLASYMNMLNPPALTPDQEKARQELKDLLHDLTTSDYDKKLEALNNKFNDFRQKIGGDTPDLIRAYRLEFQKLREEFDKLTPTEWVGGMAGQLKAGLGGMPMNMMAGPLNGPAIALSTTNVTPDLTVGAGGVDYAKRDAEMWAEQFQKQWDSTVSSMSSSFTSSLVNGSNDFIKSFRQQMLTLFVDRSVTQQIFTPMISQLWGPTGMLNTIAFGQNAGLKAGAGVAGATYGQLLGAGALGYGIGGIGGALGGVGGYAAGTSLLGGLGAFASGGALAGLAGPVGMVAGIALSKVAEGIMGSKPPKPHIDLLYEAIDGQIKLVSESFSHTPRSQELLDTVQKSLQTQIDFYGRIAELTSGAMADFSVALSGKKGFDIIRGTQINSFEMMTAGFSDISKMIPGFQGQFQKLWGETFADMSEKGLQEAFDKKMSGVPYSWRGEMTGTSPEEQLQSLLGLSSSGASQQQILDSLKTWLSGAYQQKFTEPGYQWNGDYYPEKTYDRSVGGMEFLGTQDLAAWDEYFNKISEKFYAIQTDLANMLGNAFLESVDTTGFQGFGDTLEKLIGDKIKTGLAQGFTNQALDIIMKGSTGFAGAFGLLGQLGAGEGGVTLNDVQSAFQASFGQMDTVLEQIRPIFDVFSEGIKKLDATLGLNTVAVQSNTDAVLGPVNSFLMSLDTGPLAASQSLASLSGYQNKLYTAAFANPESFSEYASYMTSNYLPAMQALSPDYTGVISGVKGQVNDLPWYNSGGSLQANDIGTAVAAAVAPMLLDIKKSANITVQIIVDGNEIKSAVISSLNDSSVVNKMRSRV